MATQKANDGSSERSSKEMEVFTVSNTVYADEENKEMSVHNLSSQSMQFEHGQYSQKNTQETSFATAAFAKNTGTFGGPQSFEPK